MPRGINNPKLRVRVLRGSNIVKEQTLKLRELSPSNFLFVGKIQGKHVEIQLVLGDVLRVRNRVRRLLRSASKK